MTERLDHALASRRLARSRTAAARLIADGQVEVNGKVVVKAARTVSDADQLRVREALAYVSRSAEKLLVALDEFEIDPSGRVAIDFGASTGGFTQVLLERGASEVIALDVGHDQLAPILRSDVRVTNIEGENARYLDATKLDRRIRAERGDRPALTSADIGLVVGDISFISLRHIVPAMRASVPQLRDAVLLVKPQFEVGRTQISGGIVRDAAVAADAAIDVVREATECGLALAGFVRSPITGTHGNREFLAWFRPDDSSDGESGRAPVNRNQQQWEDHIRSTVAGGTA
ncbi:TlyA family RNA methyltransferase [Gulosibacter macacae]|uniref:TlyA family RNA methyltransferase n=1 Tax=Gulosibacter macacae TaxID=2488791 RepID=UPI001F3D5343|nr:TlyA family RNA methyltransferase [Gulosibacter macacae]